MSSVGLSSLSKPLSPAAGDEKVDSKHSPQPPPAARVEVSPAPLANNPPPGPGRFTRCCSYAFQKICGVFFSCRRSRPPQPIGNEAPMVSAVSLNPKDSAAAASAEQANAQPSLRSRIASKACNVLNNPYFISAVSVISAGTVIASAVLVAPVYSDYSNACAPVLNGFTGDLISCREPYTHDIAVYQATNATFCALLGYILQKVWEIRTESNAQPPQPAQQVQVEPPSMRLKKWVRETQTNYGYEISLSLGYLYNGLWIDTASPASWNAYFDCQAAAIGLAASFLGMYARTQWVFLRECLAQKAGTTNEERRIPINFLRNNVVILTSSGISVITLGLGVSSLFPSEARRIVSDISMMLLVRPIGKMGLDWLDQRKLNTEEGNKRKVLVAISTVIKILPTPMIALGYYSYLSSATDGPQLVGTALFGLAQGIKESSFQSAQVAENVPINSTPSALPLQVSRCAQRTHRIWEFVKDYWKTGALIAFSVVAAEVPFLNCYDQATAVCPLAFELSSNYLIIESEGIDIAIGVGLAHYYARKLFKVISKQPNQYIQRFSKGYLHLSDKYQFDLLSVIPYSMIRSGIYTKSYSAFAAFNPASTLVLIGVTFATYKENVNSGVNDPYRPLFTDTSIVSGAFPI